MSLVRIKERTGKNILVNVDNITMINPYSEDGESSMIWFLGETESGIVVDLTVADLELQLTGIH